MLYKQLVFAYGGKLIAIVKCFYATFLKSFYCVVNCPLKTIFRNAFNVNVGTREHPNNQY